MNLLKKFRKAKGLTQDAVMEALGIPKRIVAKHENSARIYWDDLVQYADLYEARPEDLFPVTVRRVTVPAAS